MILGAVVYLRRWEPKKESWQKEKAQDFRASPAPKAERPRKKGKLCFAGTSPSVTHTHTHTL